MFLWKRRHITSSGKIWVLIDKFWVYAKQLTYILMSQAAFSSLPFKRLVWSPVRLCVPTVLALGRCCQQECGFEASLSTRPDLVSTNKPTKPACMDKTQVSKINPRLVLCNDTGVSSLNRPSLNSYCNSQITRRTFVKFVSKSCLRLQPAEEAGESCLGRWKLPQGGSDLPAVCPELPPSHFPEA